MATTTAFLGLRKPAKTGGVVGKGDLIDAVADIGDNMEIIDDYLAGPVGTASVTVFTASGTWNKPAGTKTVRVRVIGGGGAGGGVPVTTASRAIGGGGGGGGCVEKFYSASSLGSSEPVVVGATKAGSAGLDGGNGNPSTFSAGGNLLTGAGGVGGQASGVSTTGTIAAGGAGGAATGGDINTPGGPGSPGFTHTNVFGVSGKGGDTPLGFGGQSSAAGSGDAAGNAGANYGSGGGGATGDNNAATFAGGAGAAGVVIVESYL